MGKPITIPLTNLKRSWKFNWFLGATESDIGSSALSNLKKQGENIINNARETGTSIRNFVSNLKNPLGGGINGALASINNSIQDLKKIQILSDPVLCMYVSQLAKTVDLPDDEVEFEYVQVGNVDYPVPTKWKVNPIRVTYYDDNLDTVYNFHKFWINMARTDESNSETAGMTMNIINSDLCKAAKYVVYEDSLNTIEYSYLLKYLNKGMSALTSATEKITAFFNLPDVSELGEVVDPFLKWHSSQTFPTIFPQTVSRSSADKTGEGLSEVTVTYIRVPNLIGKRKAYTGTNSFGLDE